MTRLSLLVTLHLPLSLRTEKPTLEETLRRVIREELRAS